MAPRPQFAFNDAATFDVNVASFSAELIALDAKAGPVLAHALSGLADATEDRLALLTALLAALTEGTKGAQVAAGAAPKPAAPAPAPKAVQWFLEGVEIEGFRGINNEGAPLVLKFKRDSVNSISAPNAVGKSSIYDGISFALRGKIEKLDRLLQSERPQDYYINRFHQGRLATAARLLRLL
jgi:hypothetical protein